MFQYIYAYMMEGMANCYDRREKERTRIFGRAIGTNTVSRNGSDQVLQGPSISFRLTTG